ncbi:MAG: OsmC family protein, partial [Propionibacteriaceae bacterium]
KAQPELAKFQFRAVNRWVDGTHNRSTIDGYFGAGQEHRHAEAHHYDADHPPVLTGRDHGPTPVEFLLHALAACLTSGLVNIAAARGITLHEVSSTVEGDIDLLGILGLDRDTRNGYQRIKVTFTISGEASAEQLQELVSRSQRRSAVLDVLTHGTPVDVDVVTV